jgi:hypothetical protein
LGVTGHPDIIELVRKVVRLKCSRGGGSNLALSEITTLCALRDFT